jgi:hypothetical protein
MPSTEYFDDYTYSDNFDDQSNASFHKVEKVRKKNKVSIGKHNNGDGDDDFIYSSGNVGSFICNAKTGYKTRFIVGSRAEDLFFKVIDASARDKDKNPAVFFFESPEQFERTMRQHHSDFTLPQKTIRNWYKKQP